MFIVVNRAGVALALCREPARHFPSAGILMQGDTATFFESEAQAEEAIWRTITWAEREAERESRRRFDWAHDFNAHFQ